MRVLYIGKSDSLAAEIVNCFRKEDNDLYLMSEREFEQGVRPALKYKNYTVTGSYADTEKFFYNIKPEMVIFAGELYQEEEWKQEERTNLFMQQLLNVLNFSVFIGVEKFIFLSSSHTLGASIGLKAEGEPAEPVDYKGIIYAQAENMVRLWTGGTGTESVILRTDMVIGCGVWEGSGSLPEKIVESFKQDGKYTADSGRIYSPVSVRDLANAILRCSGITASSCYHVAGNETVTQVEIAELINKRLEEKYEIEVVEREQVSYSLSAARLKEELEWLPFYSVEAVLESIDIRTNIRKEKKKQTKWKNQINEILMSIENFIIFGLFALASIWLADNSAMGRIDLMAIYVLMAGLIFGMKQSVPSILYSCIFSIIFGYEEQITLMAVMTNIATLLQFAVYIFIGVASGYTVDHYKLKLKERETEYRFLEKEYEAINEINRDNLMIKQEYHKRLLNYKNSLPKLYSVISRLTVLEPERIFSETVQAVKDIMEVENAAVYVAKQGSSYMRLIASSGGTAVAGSKSWNLEEYPAVKEAFDKDEVYISNMMSEKEPALAAPIFYQGNCIAALVIKEVPFTYLNLNYTNLFKTLSVMITSSIVKAKDYEKTVRSELYLPETEILYPYEFGRMLDIARDKKKQNIADFCILKMKDKLSATEIYFKSVNLFRNTDFFGIDNAKNLYLLLGNTSEKEAGFAVERIIRNGLTAEYISDMELDRSGFGQQAGKEAED